MATLDPETRFKTTGRNDDCPCGSGKKYKKCHLREDEESLSKALSAKNAEAAKEAESEESHEGHDHAPGEHPRPGRTAAPKPFSPAKAPLSNKPVSSPRKAV
jgi:hypothetical protein